MLRPGPLQELPLHQFLPPNPNLPGNATQFKSRPNKRPLSPGGPSLYSPAKRRILNEEGVFSPEKTLKSPVSASRSIATSAFADVLRGPNSPVRKLDFGLPKNHVESSGSVALSAFRSSATPAPDQQPTPSATPTTSLGCKALGSFSSLLDNDDIDDYFSSPHLPIVIPREIPLPPDPQSLHYPGFMIHQDARVVLRARSVSVESDVLPSDSCSDTDTDKEEQKENIAPRRRARKVVAPPDLDPINPMLFSPHPKEMGMARSTPSTPKKNPSTVSARETSMTPTPRRPGTGARQIFPSPGITPVVKEKERLERKRVLEDEVNEMRGDDEDDDDLVT